jgi:hypothetical protein
MSFTSDVMAATRHGKCSRFESGDAVCVDKYFCAACANAKKRKIDHAKKKLKVTGHQHYSMQHGYHWRRPDGTGCVNLSQCEHTYRANWRMLCSDCLKVGGIERDTNARKGMTPSDYVAVGHGDCRGNRSRVSKNEEEAHAHYQEARPSLLDKVRACWSWSSDNGCPKPGRVHEIHTLHCIALHCIALHCQPGSGIIPAHHLVVGHRHHRARVLGAHHMTHDGLR